MSLKTSYIQELANWKLWAFPTILGLILIPIAQYNFTTFHTLAEFFAIFISLTMFAFAWVTDGFTNNKFLIFLACGYFAIGMLDMAHTFAYPGVDFFIEGNTNQASQFWIITRYFEAFLLLLAPSYIDRHINKFGLLMVFVSLAVVAFVVIVYGYFPVTFIEGVGLTAFKVNSEYIILLILAGSIYRILQLRDRISQTTKTFTILAVMLTMAAELMFTFYVDAFDLSNLAGHIFKIFSYWMIFQAIVLSNLRQPYLDLNGAYEDLQLSEDKRRTIIDSTSQGYWMVNGDNITIDVNEALCTMLGYTRDDMIGTSTNDFVNAENKKIFIGQQAHKADQRHRRYEIELTARDGRQISTLFAATTMQNLDGNKPYSFALITDISEQKCIEAELLRHREHLEELVAERTAEVREKASQLEVALESEKNYSSLQQQFVSLVSHEFRTPLSIIDGAVHRIIRLKDKITPEQLVERGDKIRHAVQRMVELIDSTLYAENLDQGNFPFIPKALDLKAMIAAACDYQAEISPDHQIRLDIDALPPAISADGKLLKHAFQNLLSNAVKYSLNSPQIEVKGWTESDFALISIKDYGVGIPANDLPNMFQRFFRATTSKGIPGTGVGLSVCKQFIEMHGGDISIESIEGEGATFTVKLPIAATPAPEISA